MSNIDSSGMPLLLLMSNVDNNNKAERDHGSGASTSSSTSICCDKINEQNQSQKKFVDVAYFEKEPIAGFIGNGSGKSTKQKKGKLTNIISTGGGDSSKKNDGSFNSSKNLNISNNSCDGVNGNNKNNGTSTESGYWVQMKDGKGRTYYYDVITKKTRWDKPICS